MPAGVLYTHAGVEDNIYDTPGEAREKAISQAKKLRRSGLLLDDREVLAAMDKQLSGRYIPVSLTKKGEYSKNSEKSLASLERMGELVEQLDSVITRIASEVAEGEVSARPLESEDRAHICKNCDMKAVCRSSSLG